MSYDTIKRTTNRKPVKFIELYLDRNDPAIDFSADPNSYDTPKTTDDISAFTGVDFKVYRYADQAVEINNLQFFPTNQLNVGNQTTPRIDPSVSIGDRTTLSVSIQDFVDSDAYTLQGNYSDRQVRGSHFAKLISRNEIKGRRAVIVEAYLDDNGNYNESDAKKSHFIIDSITSPTLRGVVNISLSDALKLTNVDNKKIPEQNNGVLAFDINSTATSLTFSPSVDEEYGVIGATGYIAIKEEIMSYTIATATTMTVVRGQAGTQAEELSAGDTIQLCEWGIDKNIIDWFETFIDLSDIPSSYKDTANWAALKAGGLSVYNLTRFIYKPATIKDLLNELIVVGGLTVFVDVEEEKIKIDDVPVFDNPVKEFDLGDYQENTFSLKENYKKQVTRQSILWGNPDSTNTDEANFKGFEVRSLIEAADQNGYVNAGKEIKTPWLLNNDSIAAGIANREVQRYEVVPGNVSFETDARNIGELENLENMKIGAVFQFEVPPHIALKADGSTVTRLAQCTSISHLKNTRYKVEGLSYQANIPSNVDFFISQSKTDYNLADDPEFNVLPDFQNNVAREYIVVINSGVLFSASLTSTYSFDTGTFPVGAALKIVIAGEVIGRGGRGGDGGFALWETGVEDPQVGIGSDGSNGGPAMNIRLDTTIDNLTGLIAGGGAGEKGKLSSASNNPANRYAGRGGHGGAGSLPGLGGNGGISESGGGTPINGDDGDSGSKSYATPFAGGLGEDSASALAGDAIHTNGNNVIILAGNNSNQIKGAIV